MKRPVSQPFNLGSSMPLKQMMERDIDDRPPQDSFRSLTDESDGSITSVIREKTGWLLTAITIAKSYIGVGCLAIPYGFHLCGF
jgi:amino acid permease